MEYFSYKYYDDLLGRTAASISDLERGKVKVIASDLYKISQYLKKPIEYFFGEDFVGVEIQDLVSLMRIPSPENRKVNNEYIQKTGKLQMLGGEITSKPQDDVTVEQVKDFLDLLIDITNKNRVASTKVEEATKRVLTEIEFKGMDFSDYISKLGTID